MKRSDINRLIMILFDTFIDYMFLVNCTILCNMHLKSYYIILLITIYYIIINPINISRSSFENLHKDYIVLQTISYKS